MPNPQDIFQLAQQTATQVTASPENWRRFLYTAAHNYHTTYLNQLLIHAQRPDATACATMKYWNEQAHRKVMYGSKSIIILQRHQGVPTAKRVFSMTDTVLTGDKAAAPWEVTDAIRPLLMQVNSVGSLMDRATEQVVSLSDRANRVLATSIEDSALNWSHPEDQRFILQEVAAQSTLYMICIRLGIPVREEDFPAFQNVTQFDTSRISLCLGGYVQATAEPLLDELGHEVMQLARDSVAIQAEPVHNTDTQSPTQTTSREEAVTDDVHERNRVPDSEPELAESQENQPEPVRQDAAGLLGAERAEPVRPDDAGGNAAAELPQDGAGRTADGGQDAARPDAESADARPQDKPAGLGADVQQPEAAGGGYDPSDAVRSITEEPAAAESEPSPSAFSLPEFPAELLPSLLKADTTSRASNADILSFFSKTPLLIDRLRYIRESYKVVFTELLLEDDTRVGFYKESNGLLVWQGSYLTRSAESHLSWHSVTAAIDAQNTRPAYLSLDTGELAWTSTLEKVSSRGMTTNGSTVFYSSNSGRQITAFDAETNQVVWQKDLRYDNKDRDLQEMQIDSALVYNGNSLIHVAERGRITALNPDNGEILWRIDAAGYPERVFWATPEATDSLVIATGIDGKVYAVEYTH